jgi:NAD(P)-dependent dehydrogenase (short-subunit alcohol dehydrogenase family)
VTELRFDGRVAVVTGAGRGLGKSHAVLLASRGARVVVNDLGGSVAGEGSEEDPAESVAREIREQGGEAVANTDTVATAVGGKAIVGTALAAFGRLDIVVNNAGIIRDAPFDDMTPARLDPIIDVHIRGAFNVTRSAWLTMRSQGYGRVVNTTSASGLIGHSGQSNYGTAKAGLLGLTRILALEGKTSGIRVNAIAPTAVTRMLLQAMDAPASGSDPKDREAFSTLMSRLDPGLVSPVVAYLAHESCPISGEVLSAGGGQVSRLFIGRTRGFHKFDLTVEDVHEQLAQILDESGYTVPTSPADEMTLIIQALGETVRDASGP